MPAHEGMVGWQGVGGTQSRLKLSTLHVEPDSGALKVCVYLGRPVRVTTSRSLFQGLGALAQVFEGRVVRGDPNACGHIIQASGGTGAHRQTINFSTERVVGNGSFGVVFQATCLETGETVRTPPQHPRPVVAPAVRHQYLADRSRCCTPQNPGPCL